MECHDRVCRISIDHKVARKDWQDAIQTLPSHGLTDRMLFGPETYIVLKERPPTPNEKLEIELGEAMTKRRKELERCGFEHKEPGTLRIEVLFDATTRRIGLTFAGSLATSPLAACLRPLWEAAIAETQVPSDATALSWSLPLTVE